MANLVRKTLRGSGSFTVPAGVNSIKLLAKPTRLRTLRSASGSGHVISLDYQSYSWGSNSAGQLGDNTTGANFLAQLVVGNHRFLEVAAQSNHCLARKADGSVWGWGEGTEGQLGNNSTSLNFSSPIAIAGNHQFIEIAAGGSNYSAARKADGSVFAWGFGTSGQLGNNTVTSTSSPVAVVGGHVFVEISCGNIHMLARKSDGSVWAWGANASGQLGNNTLTATSSPVAVAGGHVFTEISATGNYSIARKADGSVYAWGLNGNGQLGDNSVTTRSSPVAVVGGHVFVEITTGDTHVLARKADGSVWAWGDGASGKLGDNTATSKSSPIAVVGNGSFGFVELAAGSSNSYARRVDGSVWAWGDGTNGKLGDQTIVSKSSPVQTIGNFIPFNANTNPQNIRKSSITVTPGETISYATGSLAFFKTTVLGAAEELVLEYQA